MDFGVRRTERRRTMNGKQLKNSILQWAIQGRLVSQDSNDEPATMLLERIRAEKARLIREGKLKKDKNETIIYRGADNSHYEKLPSGEVRCIDDEIPFEIPGNWCWCRIRDISQSYIGLTYAPTDVSAQGTIVLRSSNIKDGELELKDIVRVNKPINEKLQVNVNDIIICARNGSKKLVGKSAIVKEINEPMTFGAFMAICKTQLYNYIYLFLQSDLFFSQLRKVSDTTTINQLTQNNFNGFLVPIPPYSEQERIVAKYTEILPTIEKYGSVQDELDKLNATIFDTLKKSLLQEAIQGRLVEQYESDEPALELLKRIQQEKQKLLSVGKLKTKDVVNSVIFKGDDNRHYEKTGKETIDITDSIPFAIPNTWSWVRGKVAFLPMQSIKPTGTEFCYIDIDAVNNKLNIIDKPKTLLVTQAPSRATRRLHTNDILFSMVRPYLRNIAIVKEEFKDAIASTGFYIITSSVAFNHTFLYYLLLSPYVIDGLNEYMKGDNSPSINNYDIEHFLFPLPPLAEQQRIVTKIEKCLGAIQEK